ncbi:MAG: hypothetical protein ACE5Q3_18030 [Alphaproteobacteria bacterium]
MSCRRTTLGGETKEPAAEIEERIKHTDRGAEVHDSLRLGTPVELASFEAQTHEQGG